jgi:4-hydroxy-2-oxoheptanedioate aldolase
MRPNRTKRLLGQGQPAIGTFCLAASALIAEMLGHSGLDFVMVDLQHGESTPDRLQNMLQALSATPATPLVRVSANAPVDIQRALDMGAAGVVVPTVNTREEAEAAVRAVRYAPIGVRSWGPLRGALYLGAEYFAKAHEELLTILMIESAEGCRNAREILGVPGVDACFIGPNDLSITLGFPPGLAELPPPVEEAVAAILAAARATGKTAGIQVFDARAAAARVEQGFRFVSVMSEIEMVRDGAAELLRAVNFVRAQGATENRRGTTP